MKLVVEDLEVRTTGKRGLEERPLFSGLSFSLDQAEILALSGPSGIGKTTVALAILDLLPAGLKVTRGRVFCDGAPVGRRRGSLVGMTFQDASQALDPNFRIGAQLEEVARLDTADRSEARRISLEMLERVGLEDAERRLKDFPIAFSGGELQRIVLARALIREPSFLLVDETTSSLDLLVQGKILALLRSFVEELNLGLLLITHDRRVVRAMADREIRLEELVRGDS